jgi:VIT1/CCC1 family predicted Fe2+/Mn2+ transporter
LSFLIDMENLQSIQTEVDASFLYALLAEHEEDPNVARVFKEMSEIEMGHARAFLQSKNLPASAMPSPSGRAKTLKTIGRIFGYDYVLGVLLDTEKGLSAGVIKARKEQQLKNSISDTAHVSILRNLLHANKNIAGAGLARFEKRHRNVGGNAIRAAVLGGNDGLVSNFSLVMGVAGASAGSGPVLMTGLAGMLAGALSMSLGEWISVKSSQELSENQMALEAEELEINPAGEEQEIALIYMAKGIPEEQAKTMAADIMKNKDQALDMLVKEELGINEEELKGSAMEAAYSSFFLFLIGAIIPVIPFFFTQGFTAIILSTLCSALGLFGIGAAITLFTNRNVWFSGMRQVLFGLMAAAITYGIGALIGAQL